MIDQNPKVINKVHPQIHTPKIPKTLRQHMLHIRLKAQLSHYGDLQVLYRVKENPINNLSVLDWDKVK